LQSANQGIENRLQRLRTFVQYTLNAFAMDQQLTDLLCDAEIVFLRPIRAHPPECRGPQGGACKRVIKTPGRHPMDYEFGNVLRTACQVNAFAICQFLVPL